MKPPNKQTKKNIFFVIVLGILPLNIVTLLRKFSVTEIYSKAAFAEIFENRRQISRLRKNVNKSSNMYTPVLTAQPSGRAEGRSKSKIVSS